MATITTDRPVRAPRPPRVPAPGPGVPPPLPPHGPPSTPAPRLRRSGRRRAFRPRPATVSWTTLLGLLVHLIGAPKGGTPSVQWPVFLGLVLCLTVTALLTSGRIVRIAEDRPDGPLRDRAMALASGLDNVARRTGLHTPALLVNQALGRPDDSAALAAHIGPASPTGSAAPAGPALPQASTATATTPTPAGPDPAPAQSAPLEPAPATTPAPEPAPPPLRQITQEAPLRVHVAGDSFAEWLGYEMARYGVATRLLTSQLDFHLSSGLLSPMRLNWPVRLAQTMGGAPPPEAVVLFLGANDFDNIRLEGRTLAMQTPAWQAEYGRRAGELMDTVGAAGARMYWIGMPVLRDGRRNGSAFAANAAVAEAAESRPWVRFVDIWSLFADAEGRYATFRPGPSGEVTRVRQEDGIHLTRPATNWVAGLVYDELQRDWGLP